MRVIVFHNRLPIFWDEAGSSHNYVKVCSFFFWSRSVPEALEMAFFATNTIEEPWYKKKGLEIEPPGKFRSTSVGDMVAVDEQVFLCCNCGWKRLLGVQTNGTTIKRWYENQPIEIASGRAKKPNQVS